MAKQEVSEVATTSITYAAPGSVSFDELSQEAATLPGNELLKDEELESLVGVDFIITRAVIRKGVPRNPGNPWMAANKANQYGGYASLEITTTPRLELAKINRARKASGLSQIHDVTALVEPEGHYVLNDGSTGIYRQIVAILAMQGYVELPEGKLDGESGSTIFDTIPAEWVDIKQGESIFDSDGFLTYDANLRIRCKNGIRLSDYTWGPDNTESAQTRYLA